MKVHINTNLHGSKLKQFIGFIKNVSNTYSIARRFDGSLSEDMLQEINQELRECILQEDKERREKYSKNPEYRKFLNTCLGISNQEEAERYFNNILSQELQMIYYNFSVGGMDHKFERVGDDFVKARYTRTTLVTRGGIFEVCYFTYGPTLSEILSQINTLFQMPYNIGSYQFMDLAFYHGQEVKLAICSHEQFASMDLSEEEFNQFITLDIPHEL